MQQTPGSQIDLNLALYCNLTTEWVVTPIEEAKIFFKEMLWLIYLAPGDNTGIEVEESSVTVSESNNPGLIALYGQFPSSITNIGMLKAAIKLTFLIALGITGHAQKRDEPNHNLKPKNYLGFSFIPSFSEKAKIDGDKDTYDLHSHSRFGLEALVQYHLNFAKNYSLILGAGGNVFNTCIHFHIPKEMFDPPTDSDITSGRRPSHAYTFLGPSSIKMQAELLRRWRRNKVHNWNFTAGLSLLYSMNSGQGQTWDVIDHPSGQTQQICNFY